MIFDAFLLACIMYGSKSADDQGTLCDLVSQVRVIPFKGESVDDNAYNTLREERLRAIPCLVEKLDDVTPMHDPRKAPSHNGVTVGDTALFLLVDFTGVPFDEMFPKDLKRRYRKNGVDAYFEFVRTTENRLLLQKRWQTWLDDRKSLKDTCQPKNENGGSG